MTTAGARGTAYALVGGLLPVGYLALRSAPARPVMGGEALHLLLEVACGVVAVMVGVAALLHHRAGRRDRLLFLGAAFVGAGVLDLHHAVVTSTWLDPFLRGAPPSLTAWSWSASRVFLSFGLVAAWWVWRDDGRGKAGDSAGLRERVVYLVALAGVVGSALFFALAPLPPAYLPGLATPRPQEFLAGAAFAVVLVGFLRQGEWRTEFEDHWVVLGLILSVGAQAFFMPFSRQLYDPMFEAGHAMKLASYLCVAVGLGGRMLGRLHEAERSARAVEGMNRSLREELSRRRRAEDELRSLSRTLEVRVAERTEQLRHQRAAAISMAEDAEQARRALYASEARLQAVLDNAPAAIYVKDLEGRYQLTNRRFEELFGLEPGEMLGRTDEEFLPPEAVESVGANDREVARLGSAIQREESVPSADGELRHYMSVKFPLRTREGVVEGVGGISTDITELRSAQDELIRVAEELARSNTDLQQFAYVASHDLQEPLRMVASYTELLARRYGERLDDDAHDFIGFAVDGARRMQRLIEDLLSYSRVQTRAQPFEVVDVDQALTEVLSGLEVRMKETGAIVRRDPLPPVLGDPAQLRRLLQNLLTNALKFTRPGETPEVHVTARREGPAWRFSVRDRGIGMPPEESDRIFVIFQRLHTRVRYEGTGIGLAICKRIVERHGGRIWVDAQPDAGSTFHFTIPDHLVGQVTKELSA